MVAWRYEFYFLLLKKNIYIYFAGRSFVKFIFYHSKIKFISLGRGVKASTVFIIT